MLFATGAVANAWYCLEPVSDDTIEVRFNIDIDFKYLRFFNWHNGQVSRIRTC